MQFLFKLFSKLFSSQIQKLISDAFALDRENAAKLLEARNVSQLTPFINAPVICFDGDIANPVVGMGLRIGYDGGDKTQRLIVKDYLTGREVMVRWKLYPYSRPLLVAAFELDKKALMSLIWQNHDGAYYREFTSTKEPLLTFEEAVELLANSGFFVAVDVHYNAWQAISNVSQLIDPLAIQRDMNDPNVAAIIEQAKNGVYGGKS